MDIGSFIAVVIALVMLLLLGAPVGIAMGAAGTLGLFLVSGTKGLEIAVQTATGAVNNYIILAVPLFVTMGVFLGRGGLGRRIFDIFNAFLRQIPGGVGVATVLSCAVLSAMIGTSVAVAAMVGSFALPNLRRLGYSLPLSMGIIAGGGALGILIPPSIPLILYGVIAQESVGRLFLSGFIPGILAAGFFATYVMFCVSREKVLVEAPASWSERWKALKEGYWGLLVPIFVLVTLYTGLATPVEVAALGCILTLLVSCFVYRTINGRNFMLVLREAVTSSVMILFIIVGALVLAKFVTIIGLDRAVGNLFVTRGIPSWGFILITMLIILAMGCFMEGASIMLIMLPILIVSIHAYGINPYVYAILFVINIECAMLTPPIGLNLFAVDGIAKSLNLPSTLGVVVRGSFPFLLLYLLVMLLVAVFPGLALWLPAHMM